MTWHNPYQRNEQWIKDRLGKITASRVSRVINGTIRGWATFAAELAYEASPEYVHNELDYVDAISNGKKYEPIAIANAQIDLAEEFEPVGFVTHPEYTFLGASSDFLARGGRWNGEVKCPLLLEQHMLVQQYRQMPKEHYPQVQCQMACNGTEGTIFISYYSGNKKIPTSMRTATVEVLRDDRYIAEMIERCHEFNRYRTGQTVVTRRNNSSLAAAARLF